MGQISSVTIVFFVLVISISITDEHARLSLPPPQVLIVGEMSPFTIRGHPSGLRGSNTTTNGVCRAEALQVVPTVYAVSLN